MKRTLRPALALLLGVSAVALTACDYAPYSPGKNPQQKNDFVNPPGYTNADVNADSINNKQNVHTPIGVGSATAIKNGSVNDKLNSAPSGNSTASPQNANGKMGSVDQADPANSGNSSTNGMPKK